ncbi:MAG: hydrogenase maturation protease [Coriobacteriales bacterium]|jgi:hydrogenase maturation protease|nr:hydrogenase maturation protease [Coriobacteriales bacterium]
MPVKNILILCIGNILMQDDGIGPRVAAELCERYDVPANVSIMDKGTMGMALLADLKRFNTVLVVDAVDNTGLEPGTVVTFSPQDMAPNVTARGAHDTRFVDVLQAAELLGYRVDGHCLGVQVLKSAPVEFTIGLSPPVEAALPILLNSVLDFLTAQGAPATPKPTTPTSA